MWTETSGMQEEEGVVEKGGKWHLCHDVDKVYFGYKAGGEEKVSPCT